MVHSVDTDAGVAEEALHVANLAVECRVAQWREPGVDREGNRRRRKRRRKRKRICQIVRDEI